MRDEFLAFAEVAQQVPTGWAVVFAMAAFLGVIAFLCWLSQRRREGGHW